MKLAEFGTLWPAEERLVAWLRAGNREVFEVSPALPGPEAPREVRLRASFLRALALGGFEDCAVSEKGLRVAGGYVEGDGPEGGETRGLDLEGCTLAGDLELEKCRFADQVLLRGARLKNLFLSGSTFAQGLGGERLEAQGGVSLDGVTATGEVRLLGAKLGGNLDCEGAKFMAATGGKALNADGAHIVGALFLRKGAEVRGVLDLTAAEIGLICDDLACWPGKGDLLLNRCRYGAFTGGPVDAKSRINWLALQNPARWGKEFWPQPYEECARVLREMGHQAAAREVLIAKERLQRGARRAALLRDLTEARTARDARGPVDGVLRHRDRVIELQLQHGAVWAWDALLGLVLGYGRKPQNAAFWGLGVLLFGWLIFAQAAGFGAIKSNLPQIQRAPEWVACAPGYVAADTRPETAARNQGDTQLACFLRQPEGRAYPRFNAFIYSADTLIPVVALEMQSYWIPDDSSPRGALARVYLWLHIALGWGLTLLAVAGFSGLIKMDSK